MVVAVTLKQEVQEHQIKVLLVGLDMGLPCGPQVEVVVLEQLVNHPQVVFRLMVKEAMDYLVQSRALLFLEQEEVVLLEIAQAGHLEELEEEAQVTQPQELLEEPIQVQEVVEQVTLMLEAQEDQES